MILWPHDLQAGSRDGTQHSKSPFEVHHHLHPHMIILYDFEGSPWCRLVREYATILDLTLNIRPCPRETLFYGEGTYSQKSRFRPKAMEWHKNEQRRKRNHDTEKRIGPNEQGNDENDDHLTFPLLVDLTNFNQTDPRSSKFEANHNENVYKDGVVVLTESYDILCHLWETYGDSVIPSSNTSNKQKIRRPDQLLNSSSIPFPIRFLSLAGPSFMRPWPRCGLMRFPTLTNPRKSSSITLYQAENCPESRLVREVLCSLELPYCSVPVAAGSHNKLPSQVLLPSMTHRVPLLEISLSSKDKKEDDSVAHIVGAKDCVDYLTKIYRNNTDDRDNSSCPSWFDALPEENLGRQSVAKGESNSIAIGAYTAFWKGTRAFVPKRALE